ANRTGEYQKIRVSLLTTRKCTQGLTLLLFSNIAGYKAYQNDIDTLNTSLEVSTPVMYGYPRDQVLMVEGGETDNALENDPATTRSSGGEYLVFTGLVSFDPNLNLVPELAKNWDVSADGLTYTFHLEPDAKFHNNRPVTADDVVYSWERAANPETKSDTVVTYLGDIKGVEEMRAGNAEHISGLKIMDAHTLQVTLKAPVPYFIMKLTYPTGYIVDKDNVAMGVDWYRTPNGTGPYRLTRWEEKKMKVYELFDGFYGAKPKTSAIVTLMYQGTSKQLYEQGMIDYAGVYSSDLVRFTDPTEPLSAQLHSGVDLCTSYTTMDVTKPPFDDGKVRQAFALSVDKEKYVNVLMNGAGLPAKGLFPPALPGYSLESKGQEYDPDKARALLAESKYNRDMPPITFTISGYGSDVSNRISGLVQMWEENLGVKITIQNIEPSHYQDAIAAGKHGQLISEGWCADYPDPENFADILFHSETEMNRSNYSNSELDVLLENARVEKNVTKRMEMYRQAEEIIVMDAPAIFISHGMSNTLVQPYIKGYVQTPMGIPLERYLSIDSAVLNGE
ncbi:MAG: peptide ABC transporter substrate-binding protein, partial [Leptolinea sp.]